MKQNIIKSIKKPWGYENWISDGSETPYALKKIFFKSGKKTSLQVHEYKIETNYVLSGIGQLYISKNKFDIKNFLNNGMSDEEIKNYELSLDVFDLSPGFSFHIFPGYVHRVVAITDLEFFETSTSELDDVIRLQDDTGRKHGKILEEHL